MALNRKFEAWARDAGLAGRYVRARVRGTFWSQIVRWEKASPRTYQPFQRLYRKVNPSRDEADLPAYGTTVVIDGITMAIDPEMTAFQVRKLVEGRHAAQERKLLLHRLRDGDKVLELGGGIGMLTIAMSKVVGRANVTAYEPNPTIEALARKNHGLNDVAPDLRVAMVDEAAGTAPFRVSKNFSRSSVLDHDPDAAVVDVPVHPFADVVNEVQPTVLVMDVQGAETKLLPLVPFERLRILLVELHPDLIGLPATAALRATVEKAGLKEVERAGQSFLFERAG